EVSLVIAVDGDLLDRERRARRRPGDDERETVRVGGDRELVRLARRGRESRAVEGVAAVPCGDQGVADLLGGFAARLEGDRGESDAGQRVDAVGAAADRDQPFRRLGLRAPAEDDLVGVELRLCRVRSVGARRRHRGPPELRERDPQEIRLLASAGAQLGLPVAERDLERPLGEAGDEPAGRHERDQRALVPKLGGRGGVDERGKMDAVVWGRHWISTWGAVPKDSSDGVSYPRPWTVLNWTSSHSTSVVLPRSGREKWPRATIWLKARCAP